MRYFDRTAAGQALAHELSHFAVQHPMVLGIPRGGVRVAAEIARALGADLDICVARKLRAPDAPELAIGAMTSDGALLLNQDIIAALGVREDWISAETKREQEESLRQERELRGGQPGMAVAGRVVILVDDGLATGATLRAAVRSLRARGAGRIVVAVPVAAEGAFRLLQREVDEVFCPSVLHDFGSVGAHYAHFEPVANSEVAGLLAGLPRPAHP
ncbi:MAG: phosphoribosyltransferase family protein [Gemmatimonadota bacterium]|nr:phosphoribosyltransferase family protein [Gemmatimonadota bacterium]